MMQKRRERWENGEEKNTANPVVVCSFPQSSTFLRLDKDLSRPISAQKSA